MNSSLVLLWRQIRHQNAMFWRTPVAAFFTLALPLMFLLLFNVIFGGEEVNGTPFAQFFTPAIATFSAVSATFTNLAIGTALSRDLGILKRVRGTPLPPWIYMGGRIGSGVWIASISVVIMFMLGWLIYDVQILWENIAVMVLVFVIGIATFSAFGLAVAAVVRSGEAVPAVAQAIILPMAFISGIFFDTTNSPAWLEVVGNIFPLKHFAALFVDSFNPFLTDPILGWNHIGVMIAWGIASLVVATRFFIWEPNN